METDKSILRLREKFHITNHDLRKTIKVKDLESFILSEKEELGKEILNKIKEKNAPEIEKANKYIKELEVKAKEAEQRVREELREWVESWGAIPETNEYANGWNNCRKELYSGFINLLTK